MLRAPALSPDRLDQVAALPLGGRLLVDAWSGRLELLRTMTLILASAREKAPLAITPLFPHLKYVEQSAVAPLP
jgi:hypothetical protein